MNPLQRLVVDRLAELDLSYRAAAQRSNGLISHGHINAIALGRLGTIQPRSVRGLALALDCTPSVIQAAVTESIGKPPVEFKLPKKADKLTPTQRKAVLAFVETLLQQNH